MGAHSIRLPVLQPDGNLTSEAFGFFLNNDPGSDLPIDEGDAWLLVLGYLAETWQAIVAEGQSLAVAEPVGVQGEAIVVMDPLILQKIQWAVVNITSPVPSNVDEQFGRNPIIYVGQCAFGESQLQKERSVLGGLLQGGVTNSIPLIRHQLQYVNFGTSKFMAPAKTCDQFWIHLKPGVRGTVTLGGRAVPKGVGMDCGDEPKLPQHCNFNPAFFTGFEEPTAQCPPPLQFYGDTGLCENRA